MLKTKNRSAFFPDRDEDSTDMSISNSIIGKTNNRSSNTIVSNVPYYPTSTTKIVKSKIYNSTAFSFPAIDSVLYNTEPVVYYSSYKNV